MTKSQLRTQTALFAEDPSQTRFVNQYTDAMDRAQEQFAMDSKALFKNASDITIVSGTSAYDLPTDFMWEKKVTCDGLKLLPISREDLEFYKRDDDWTEDEGTPQHYIIDPEEARKQIKIYPIPGDNDADKIVVLTYYPFPAAMDDDADVPLNASTLMVQFHMGIAAYAAWLLLGSTTATAETQVKLNFLWKIYQDAVSNAIQTFKNTQSAGLRVRGGRYW